MRFLPAVLLFFLLLNLVIPAMAVDPVVAGEHMVSGGIKDFFVSGADSLYAGGNGTISSNALNNSSTDAAVDNKYGTVVGSVYTIASFKHDPYTSKTVQSMRERRP
jgi:hypothetical protein